MITSSGLKGASAVIYAGPCWYLGVTFVGDTGKEPTLTIYNNATEGSGTVVDFVMVSDECHTVVTNYSPEGVYCSAGIYASLSAAEGDYVVRYRL